MAAGHSKHDTMKKLFIACLCLFICFTSQAQKDHLSSKAGSTTFGLGIGLPYGGFGARLGTNVADELNLFAGVGSMLAGVGYNIGIRKDFASDAATQFYLMGMYGTNAAIKISGLSELDEVFTGPSFGLGIKINSRENEGNYWDVGLILPVTSSDFSDAEEAVKNDPRVEEFTESFPVLITIGYNFNI